tara:strand:- start:228 stop:692 length:465 start_codon:yes stop_codon:yes gene_type:complete
MVSIGRVVDVLDEDGDVVEPGRGGLPSDVKLLQAVRRLDHPDTTTEQHEKYVRRLRRATRELLSERGVIGRDVPGFVRGDWLASSLSVRDGVPRSVAVCTLVHGVDVIGWETSGPDESGVVVFEAIRRTGAEFWVAATDIDPVIVAAAVAEGLL